ncbi:MOSC domain-containing protein [Paracoccus litorisediminis]|uniref:MOSC domain-containing protein n=1 Tax=Paracoccus litorisediminis TaxID=2006130 RepID=A0A844HKM9_9RHOB|nr:MOSC domain-containing protein [Paracoccus litorisediminis]MTH58262.1 MOSC domain-containing protein [Paracoccus litorisediminis]
MTGHIARIRRYPIKSLGGEDMTAASLRAAHRLPGDRVWAMLTEAGERHAGDGPQPERWLPKSCFLRGVASATLQAVSGGWGEGVPEGSIRLSHPELPDLSFDPETEGARLLDWVAPLWPADKPAATRLVRGPTGWTDVNQPWVSILSLSSLRDLETRLGQPLGIERWRANLWVDGWEAYAEQDMIGQILTIGDVELRVTEAIGRCAATSANTETGRLDCDMPAALTEQFGHHQFGIYAEVVTGGEIALNDEIRP